MPTELEPDDSAGGGPRRSWLPRESAWMGLVLGLSTVLVVAAILSPIHEHLDLATPALALAVPVGLAGLLGGRLVAVVVSVLASIVFLFAFIPPVGSVRISLPEDVVALAFFLIVALTAGIAMANEADRRRAAVTRADTLEELHASLQAAVAERDQFEAETRRLLVLEEVDRQRRALLRAVSHELRTPLGTIRAITSDLQAGTDFDQPTRDRLLDIVAGETERLDRIVANLLSLSRIEAGALRPDQRPADLADIVEACVARLHHVLRGFDLRVELPDLPAVNVDFTQVDQVLSNLIENAAKHSPAGSTICVTAVATDGFVETTVSDEGPGVDSRVRAVLFEPFEAGRGGTGIGLAICRAIVEAHAGTIRLGDSDIGARFVVTLPIAG